MPEGPWSCVHDWPDVFWQEVEVKLSVMIPVYNVREYLGDCIDSLNVAMEYAGCANEVETVFVDDGSTDGSSGFLDDLACRHAWMRVFHCQNCGVAAARNFALGKVCGEYLTWVDPDDMVEVDYFRVLLQAFAGRPDAVVFDYSSKPGGVRHYRDVCGTLPAEIVWRDIVRDERIKSFLWSKAVRRELVPLPLFNETYAVMSDFEAMGRLFRQVKTVEYVWNPIYIYRQRTGSIVNQPVPDRMIQMFRVSLKRLKEVTEDCHADALSCAMYHAYHYCHMAAKFPAAGWNDGGRLDECRHYIRRYLLVGIADSRNGFVRKAQFLIAALGLMRVAVFVRRFMPGGRAY